VLGGLARQAKKKGPEAVAAVVQEHGDEAALTDPERFLEQQAQAEDPLGGLGNLIGGGKGGGLGGLLGGTGGLAGLLGGSIGDMVSGAVGNFLDLEKEKAAKVLPMLVPFILAALRRETSPGSESPDSAKLETIVEEEGDPEALDQLVGSVLGGGGGLGGLFGNR